MPYGYGYRYGYRYGYPRYGYGYPGYGYPGYGYGFRRSYLDFLALTAFFLLV